ncbi:MAG: VWA domain-containing protein [Clostridiales bacterium]|jgi:Mg-chelatase subunit ChlD|nr:VWA domain-containing protein [Eubacteriales bacterium]MDH7567603.1 VWA domain-containing protein [Clostridiales bacterium]
MVFNFTYPLLLLLIPAAAAFTIIISRGRLPLPKWKRRTAMALRILVLSLLALCLAGFGVRKAPDTATTIFVYDGSDSAAKAKATAEEFIKDSLKSRKPSDKIGIVSFGQNAAVDMSPTAKPVFSAVQSKINGNFTNMEQGLKLASSLIPSGEKKRIVLVSDGIENAGDAVRQARILRQQGITLDVYPVKTASGSEVQLKEVAVPEALRLNEKFDITVKVDSTVETRASLKLFADRELAAEKDIELQEGENTFVFSDTAKKGGLVTYRAVIQPESDTIEKNNTVSAFTDVEDVARVLAVQDGNEAASELVKILGQDVKVEVSRPENLPVTVEGLQKYDAFILSDVSAEELDDRFLNSLEVCIKHQGKGLLVTGGENSYAPGGYYKTVLEKVLPVNMDIKPKQEDPNLGLVLVIDKSGSMSEGQYGIAKIELAKEAAIRSTEALKSSDMLGVIAFDSATQWVVKMQKPTDLKGIQDAIGTIRAGGGTQILPSLKEAYLALKDADTKLKHIILLTDGQAEKSGYDEVMEGINRAGITLSTVAVGREADSMLLEALSIGGNGRFYQTDVFSDIPKIFAKETFLAGKTYLNNRTFTPSLNSYSSIIKDIKAVPPLDGYVGTTPKTAATVVFTSDRDDPILATWQYGLGRTAAWTPDAKGMWTSAWMQWDQSPQFWKNLVSWLIQKKNPEDYSLNASMAAGTGTVELTLPPENRAQGERVEAVLVAPSGAEQTVDLRPVSPGVYRGSFSGDEAGVYIANVSVKDGGDTVKTIRSGVVVPYSPEYNIASTDPEAFLEKLAAEGGGRVLKSGGEVFSGALAPVESITDMTPPLLVLAIFLFLLDIALRRLSIPMDKIAPLARAFAAKGGRLAAAVYKPAALTLERVRGRRVSGRETRAAGKAGPGGAREGAEAAAGTPPAGTAGPENPLNPPGGMKGREQNKTVPPEAGSHISILLEKKKKREK